MASIKSISIILLAISLQLTGAVVIPFRATAADPIPAAGLLPSYAIPLSNGTASLPPLTKPLQVITVGRGFQNYTCASSSAADKPVSIGAVATLFDLNPILPLFAPSQGQVVIDSTPSFVLSLSRTAADGSNLPKAGQHYFNSAGVPVFDLRSSGNGILFGNKTADIKAPGNSTQGQSGAVDWLRLDAKSDAGSQGLSAVYRVLTAAGGAPATCEGQAAQLSIDYAALYYFVTA